MKRILPLFAVLMFALAAGPSLAQTFPELTGRVVDQAGILEPSVEGQLDGQLAAHEQATSNQVVVVTLTSLEERSIEDYGCRLGRHWGIGQEGRNNGVLLIVAPNERKVRIEVGYGLEGALPDVLANQIIRDEILPRFRQGDMSGGVVAGTRTILAAIEGEYEALPQADRRRSNDGPDLAYMVLITGFFLFFIMTRFLGEGRRGRRGRRRTRYLAAACPWAVVSAAVRAAAAPRAAGRGEY